MVRASPSELLVARAFEGFDHADVVAVAVTANLGRPAFKKPFRATPHEFRREAAATLVGNDADGSRYRDAYFGTFPGVWRHGDWMTVTEEGTYIVHGRSDSTINRGGVRMGSADIYAAVDAMPEIAGSLVIGAELPGGDYYMPLFVVLAPGAQLSEELRKRIRRAIREEVSPRHVPDDIVSTPALPTTLTGKKLEVPIKRLIQGIPPEKAVNPAIVADPDVLRWYVDFAAGLRDQLTSSP